MNVPNRSNYQIYQKNMYETASPHKLISLLYGAAVTNIQRSAKAYEESRWEDASRFNLKAQDIVCELMACLNEEQGGEIATNLKQLYFYCLNQLAQANIHKDCSMLQEVEQILESLKQAWQEIGKDVSIGV
jgi:flagellar protein FliS